MKVFVGADYRGFERKGELIRFLADAGFEVVDKGAYEYIEGSDFNDPAIEVATAVRDDFGAFGVLICDSAHGVTMQANRYKGIRAANCETVESAILAREHDDANVLCLSAHFVDTERMGEIAKAFLVTSFVNYERRVRRINRLDERNDYA
ncbi:MAG: RpiB/LacA/LacB family sugar-phosphate isomerase [Candidatus Saccharibacteria bacterium]|nr:RpiB/LacA/LacB family sugar-phosphate isomerase [Candidatus Saccharibacteria bacterium]